MLGGESARKFAQRAGIPPSTFQSILDGKRPTLDNLIAIARTARVTIDSLAMGDEAPVSGATTNSVAEQQSAYAPDPSADFVFVPRYDIRASAGPGAWLDQERVLDHMAFRADWVRRTLGADPRRLALIAAIGDSMEPAIRAGDLLLVDTSVDRIVDDAIYVIAIDSTLMVKRIQRFLDGAVTIKSDSPAYDPQHLAPERAAGLHVAGRVRWVGRLI